MKDLNSLFAAAENVVIPATSNSKSVNGSAQEKSFRIVNNISGHSVSISTSLAEALGIKNKMEIIPIPTEKCFLISKEFSRPNKFVFELSPRSTYNAKTSKYMSFYGKDQVNNFSEFMDFNYNGQTSLTLKGISIKEDDAKGKVAIVEIEDCFINNADIKSAAEYNASLEDKNALTETVGDPNSDDKAVSPSSELDDDEVYYDFADTDDDVEEDN